MLDLKFIRQNKDLIINAIKLKNINLNLEQLLTLYDQMLSFKKKLQSLEEGKNFNAKEAAKMKTLPEKKPYIEKGKAINKEIEDLKPLINSLEKQLEELLLLVPNIPSPNAPIGVDEKDNVPIKQVGCKPEFDFRPLDHVQILEKNNWADLVRIAKVSGTRSYALTNEMVLLEMALLYFTLDKMKSKGFTLITVPAFAREFAFIGTGHFPVGVDQVYHLESDNIYLTGTAEVVLNALHSGDNLVEAQLPILYAGFSPCFRREAGSAGRDTRGLIRVHQFYKVEQFVICKNNDEEAEYWHQQLLQTSEEIMVDLDLPYRVVDVCTGDMGPGKVRQYDIEAWVPSENKYRETHSCSSLHEWQARRVDLRYRSSMGKMEYCYTLNNTAIATPRIMVPFLENHQNLDGSINIPTKLLKYLGNSRTFGKK